MGNKKGYKQSSEHKEKISAALKKAHKEKKWGFEEGNTEMRFTGKKHTDETKNKQSEQKKINNPMWCEETRKKVSETRIRLGIGKGEKHYRWKGGISPENVKIRGSDWLLSFSFSISFLIRCSMYLDLLIFFSSQILSKISSNSILI